MRTAAPRRVVLVGFMASGKSTVGRALASRLGWAFVDTDEVVAARCGRSVAEIFRRYGETRFREEEAAVTDEELCRSGVVVASGGGWPAVPGRMEALGPDTATVWLDVPEAKLLARLSRRPGARPLVDVPDPAEAVRSLLASRRPFYGRATLTVEGAPPPAAAVELIVKGLGLMDPAPNVETRTPESRS